MTDRQATFLWMKDLLEHIGQCHEQWQSAEPPAARYLADSIRRDLDELGRLCNTLRSQDRAERCQLAGVR